MVEVTNELIFEVLKAVQADASATKSDIRDMKARLASIESFIATLHTDSTRQTIRVEELQERIERIETRLDLNDTTQ